MVDVCIISSLNNKNFLTTAFKSILKSVKFETLSLQDASTRVSIVPQTNDIQIYQQGRIVELSASLYIYYPSYYEREHRSMYDASFNQFRAYIDREWLVISDYLEYYLEGKARWINQPSKVRDSSNKIKQLSLLSKYNIESPLTMISNNPEFIVENFPDQVGIYKTASQSGFIDEETVLRANFFEKQEILQEKSGNEVSPACFQQFIDSDLELRTYCIGSKSLTCALKPVDKRITPDIRSQASESTEVYLTNSYSDYEARLQLMRKDLDLQYMVVDSLVKDGVVYFLEINPSGTWNWLPNNIVNKINNTYCQLVKHFLND